MYKGYHTSQHSTDVVAIKTLKGKEIKFFIKNVIIRRDRESILLRIPIYIYLCANALQIIKFEWLTQTVKPTSAVAG